ncbi:hypothetical protein FBY04_1298 [Pseudomonas sp. SJZ080]|uniref:hypothetical protein n=1 Tax=Pseudomonas sp. SJZ080 TaxID=2572888 RepID=UPI00119B6A37|nr:hypothetical protein [Pseudomonas sp. SJZ080]TWC47061.1 hypothetical protein FBY04_1298 [Pseudomonas sp. SJZ080]
MSNPIRSIPALTDIIRLEQANAMMRGANLALARDDFATLSTLGFSHQHIGELKQKGGFRPSSIAQNTRMITRLRQMGDGYVQ